MVTFSTNGLDALILDISELANTPEAVIDEMLMAEGEVVKRYQQSEIVSQGLVDTGLLRDSIQVFKKGSSDKRYVLVYPYGKHGEYNRKEKTKTYKNSKHGRTYTVGGDVKETTNGEVAFMMEFGAPRRGIVGRHWMRKANKKAESEAVDAAAAIYDKYLKSKNL